MSTTFLQKKNNAKSTITNNPLAAGGLTITLASSTGAKFPTTGATWLATIWDAVTYPDPSDDPNMEVVLIDSRSTDTLTINASGRGYSGTTGVEHATGSAIRMLIASEHFTTIETAVNTLESTVGLYTAWTTWTPTLGSGGGGGPMGFTGVSYGTCRYTQIGKMVSFIMYATCQTTGTADLYITFLLPVAPAITADFCAGTAVVFNGTGAGWKGGIVRSSASSNAWYIGLDTGANFAISANVGVSAQGFYEVA